MKLQPLVWAFTVLFHSASAIFSDDAFVVDYHHPLVGIPQSHATFFHKPQSASNASLLYTLSDKHVLGAINPKDGNVLWRQVLELEEKEYQSYLVAGERDGQIVTGHGETVSSWDALDGRLRWDHRIEAGSIVNGLQLVPLVDSIGTDVQDVVVVAGKEAGYTVERLAGDGTGPRWSYSDSGAASGSSASVATSADAVYYVVRSSGILSGSKAKVVVLDPSTGKEKTQYSITPDTESLIGGDQLAGGSCSGTPFLVSSEKPYKTVKFNLLGNNKQTTLTLDEKSGDIESLSVKTACGSGSAPHFLVQVRAPSKQWAEVYHINIKTGEAVKAYSLAATAESSSFALQASGSEIYVVRTTDTEIVLYSTASHGELGRWKRSGFHSEASIESSHATAEVATTKAGFAVRVAEVSSSGWFSLVRNGETSWTRPEMLAYASIGIWIDESSQSALIDDLETEATISPLTAYVHRLKRHFHDLQHLSEYLQGIIRNILTAPTSSVIDVRRRLVGEKMVVLGTNRKELIAVQTSNAGALAWQADLKSKVSADADFIYVTSSADRVTAYLSDGSLVAVNATNGNFIEYLGGTIAAEKVVQVPGSAAPVVVKIDADGKPQVATDFAPSTASEGNVIVTLSDSGTAFGWSIGQKPQRTWTLQPRAGEKFTSAVARPASDAVASVGKVLGDRSVLYKYISPNIALLAATSSTTLSIYLVDAVTGAVLHTTTHTGLLSHANVQPSALLSENWFAYTFTSQDPSTSALSTQLIISEMYESPNPNDRGALAAQTNYSSYAPAAGSPPHVITQSYTVPEPLADLAVTRTGQGITTRQLLAFLPQSNAIASIPKEVLNARRPVDRDPSNTEKEEGLFRYHPVLELEPRNILSHTREVLGVKKIITSESLLESTSLVFAFGHDVFGTSVTPSGAFDLLGKGFNKVQLLLTIVALFVGVGLVRPVVRRKMVDGRWRT